jgi:hypothetical protein
MNKTIFSGLLALALVALVGCVSTVSGGKTAGIPLVKDRVVGRYQRTVNSVFEAAKLVISENGVLNNESIIHGETNEVKTATGKVNGRQVYVKVQPVEPKVTEVIVQTRTPGGVSDLDLAHMLEKEIALKLVNLP